MVIYPDWWIDVFFVGDRLQNENTRMRWFTFDIFFAVFLSVCGLLHIIEIYFSVHLGKGFQLTWKRCGWVLQQLTQITTISILSEGTIWQITKPIIPVATGCKTSTILIYYILLGWSTWEPRLTMCRGCPTMVSKFDALSRFEYPVIVCTLPSGND